MKYRYDLATDPIEVTETPEGYLTGEARIARIGVQTYLDSLGNRYNEFRDPDDVFSKEALDSFKNRPVTMDHPDHPVDSSNAKDLQIGHIGENIRVDGKWVVAPITITDGEAIKKIKALNKVQLSAGYETIVIPESGSYRGDTYSKRQTRIRANHVAVVRNARAGQDARLNLRADAAQEIDPSALESPSASPTTGANAPIKGEAAMKQITLDGIAYDAAPEVLRHLDKQDAELQEVKALVDKHAAEVDALKEELKQAKADAAPEAIQAKVQERVALEVKAKQHLDADLGELSDRQIKEQVINALSQDAFSFEDKRDAYVDALFDLTLSNAAKRTEKADKEEATLSQVKADSAPVDLRAQVMTEIQNLWKTEGGR